MLRGRGRGGRCAEGDVRQHRERCRPARPPEREVRPQRAAHPILRNHLQKLTDLSVNPGVHQTLPETSCSALYARMLQSPWREDAKWENTGLRAGEHTKQRKSGRLYARKPTASQALWSHILPNGTPGASWWAALGRKNGIISQEVSL